MSVRPLCVLRCVDARVCARCRARSGIGHAATEGTRLLTKVLTASETAYSANPGDKIEEYPQSAGKDTLLVTALQARNNARVVFSGSLDLFSDK